MQGQIRGESLTASIETECAHCRQPFHLELTSDLTYRVAEREAAPLVFVPLVNIAKLQAPSIIDDF